MDGQGAVQHHWHVYAFSLVVIHEVSVQNHPKSMSFKFADGSRWGHIQYRTMKQHNRSCWAMLGPGHSATKGLRCFLSHPNYIEIGFDMPIQKKF